MPNIKDIQKAAEQISASMEEIASEIQKPVVQRLLRLMKFRNSYPAFNGAFSIVDSPENCIVLKWVFGEYRAIASIDLDNYKNRIVYHDAAAKHDKEVTF